ncbi:hypothetical protein FHT86_000272 [Rhizobium sp. BK313]|jgi:hypothetical protein|nr:hypothetical protein [Rhizobium sp. BK313]
MRFEILSKFRTNSIIFFIETSILASLLFSAVIIAQRAIS